MGKISIIFTYFFPIFFREFLPNFLGISHLYIFYFYLRERKVWELGGLLGIFFQAILAAPAVTNNTPIIEIRSKDSCSKIPAQMTVIIGTVAPISDDICVPILRIPKLLNKYPQRVRTPNKKALKINSIMLDELIAKPRLLGKGTIKQIQLKINMVAKLIKVKETG